MIKTIISTLAVAALLPLNQMHGQTNSPVPPMPSGQTNAPGWGHHHGWGGMTPEERFERFSDELELTADQKPGVQAIFDQWRARMQEAKTNAETQLQGILTPEQYEKFQSMHHHKRHWHKGGDEDADKGGDEDTDKGGETNQSSGDSMSQ